MTPTIVNVLDDLADYLATLPGLENQVYRALSVEEFLARAMKTISQDYPYKLGVTYFGMSGNGENPKSTVLQVRLYFLFRSSDVSEIKFEDTPLDWMDVIRKELSSRKSKTGNKWDFQNESMGLGNTGLVVYMQTWQTSYHNTRV